MARPPNPGRGSWFRKLIFGSSQSVARPEEMRSRPSLHVISPEQMREIGPSSPHNSRVAAIKQMGEVVATKRLQLELADVLWKNTKDLFSETQPAENRQLGFHFLNCLIKGQYEQLGTMRPVLFRFLQNHRVREDMPLLLETFNVLTLGGKDLELFEHETGELMLTWMDEVLHTDALHTYLGLLINVIGFNAAYLDEHIFKGIILKTCVIVATSRNVADDFKLCLELLDKILCYFYLPAESLPQFMDCMCKIMSVRQIADSTWKLMKKVLGTHLGHSGIYTLCAMLQNKDYVKVDDGTLLRGAVFSVAMALWGRDQVQSLKHPVSAVLPSFLQVLENSDSSILAFEVAHDILELMRKHGDGQVEHHVTWDWILRIVEKLVAHLETSNTLGATLVDEVHGCLTHMEKMHERHEFHWDVGRLFRIVESCAAARPVSSIEMLIEHKRLSLNPMHRDWIPNLAQLVENYYCHEIRPEIRLKVLTVLDEIMERYGNLYEEELLKNVLFKHLNHVELDSSVEVRVRAARLLLSVVRNSRTYAGTHVIDLLHKTLKRLFLWSRTSHASPRSTPRSTPTLGSASPSSPLPPTCNNPSHMRNRLPAQLQDFRTEDVAVTVEGLVSIFKTRLFESQSSVAETILEILVEHLLNHYKSEHMFHAEAHIRKPILQLLLDLRANEMGFLGLVEKGKVKYSAFIVCTPRAEIPEDWVGTSPLGSPRRIASPTPQGEGATAGRLTVVTYKPALSAITACLRMERDWPTLQMVLSGLPDLLRNKTIVLSAQTAEIDHLAQSLVKMIGTEVSNRPVKLIKSTFHSHVLPTLGCLVSYSSFLSKERLAEVVHCLFFGLVLAQSARECLRVLTVCCHEIPDVITHKLPAIFLRLSQITQTVALAIPVLEFLKTVCRLPHLCANFVQDNYFCFFTIAMPYTNPLKYSNYVVSLTYNAVLIWFLRCKLQDRRKFASYIIKTLHSNVDAPLDEHTKRTRDISESEHWRENQDSSDRNRAKSLNENSFRRRVASAAATARAVKQEKVDEKMVEFHKELSETCMDVLSRFTYGANTRGAPKRPELCKFLLDGGQAQSWVFGNKIITITTSGGAKVGPTGLCDKCLGYVTQATERVKDAKDAMTAEVGQSPRKRHRSDAVRSKSETVALKQTSKDDLSVARRAQGDSLLSSSPALQFSGSTPTPPQGVASADLMSPGAGAVAVPQTREQKMQMVDNVLMGLTAKSSDASLFSPPQVHCNCWLTQWIEIYFRRPSGNVAFVMRLLNQKDLSEAFSEVLADMPALFSKPPEAIPSLLTGADGGALGGWGAGLPGEEDDGPSAEQLASSPGDAPQIDIEKVGEAQYSEMLEAHFGLMPDWIKKTYGKEKDKRMPKAIRSATMPALFKSFDIMETGSGASGKVRNSSGEEGRTKKLSTQVEEDETPEDGVTAAASATDVSASDAKKEAEQQPDVSSPDEDQLRRTSSFPDLTANQHDQLMRGRAQSDLQQVYTRSLDLQKEFAPRSPPRGLQRQISAPPSPEKRPPPPPESAAAADAAGRDRAVSGDSGMTAAAATVSAGADLRLGSQPVARHPRLTRKTSAPQTSRPLLDATKPDVVVGLASDTVDGAAAGAGAGAGTGGGAEKAAKTAGATAEEFPQMHGGLNPSYVFLQFFHTHMMGLPEEDRPVKVVDNEDLQRSLRNLDRIFPFETHRIAVLYVGPGQVNDEAAILGNAHGSVRYMETLVTRLGHVIDLREVRPEETFIGGLDEKGEDGKFAVVWHEDIMQAVFHVATMMPTKASDPKCNEKKRHIGNDCVTIVYNDSGEEYRMGTIRGQFNFVNIIVTPLDQRSNMVTVQTRHEIKDTIGHTDTKVISDTNLAALVRNMAVNANCASEILKRKQNDPNDLFASNWLERLRHIRRLRARIVQRRREEANKEPVSTVAKPLPAEFTQFA